MLSFSYTPYGINDLEKIYKNSGYISQEGFFYNCRSYRGVEKQDIEREGHNLFAEKYVSEVMGKDISKEYGMKVADSLPKLIDKKDMFVHLLGFVYYMAKNKYLKEPIIVLPIPAYAGFCVSKKQEELIYALWEKQSLDINRLMNLIDAQNLRNMILENPYEGYY